MVMEIRIPSSKTKESVVAYGVMVFSWIELVDQKGRKGGLDALGFDVII